MRFLLNTKIHLLLWLRLKKCIMNPVPRVTGDKSLTVDMEIVPIWRKVPKGWRNI